MHYDVNSDELYRLAPPPRVIPDTARRRILLHPYHSIGELIGAAFVGLLFSAGLLFLSLPWTLIYAGKLPQTPFNAILKAPGFWLLALDVVLLIPCVLVILDIIDRYRKLDRLVNWFVVPGRVQNIMSTKKRCTSTGEDLGHEYWVDYFRFTYSFLAQDGNRYIAKAQGFQKEYYRDVTPVWYNPKRPTQAYVLPKKWCSAGFQIDEQGNIRP